MLLCEVGDSGTSRHSSPHLAEKSPTPTSSKTLG